MLKDGVVLMVICLIVLGGLAVWWTQTPAHPLNATAPQVQEYATAARPSPRRRPAQITERRPRIVDSHL